ncbi:Restriction endonuclease subunit S [Candidatus Megaera venefica]|uniref:Restriction endonuclease subunit S n=1 Tax=Candidatus Megaera venefica TaxID=2055910 RepID=A0ABU5ND64_9RICK|nr:restriction endonuclease subunit S [Candidatus Megaera venefica]MEA0971128.1 Restriction endonuclease subunit S [Candidatus Megaera venefica]
MAELDTIDVELKDLKIVKSIFARHLPYKQVWAYGSRVKWTATHTSDLDCVVFGATDSEIADAKEAFDESDIPFEVQLLNWETIPNDFKENIKEQYFILRNNGDWRETTLGEIADITSSKRIFYKEYVGEGVPFYRSKEIIEKHNKGKLSTDLYISEERYEEIKSKFGVPIQGDILLTSVGTLGIPYIVQEKETFYFKDGNLTWLKNIKSNSTSDFLYYWIVSPIGKNTLNSITIGSTQPALTISGLKEANITLPSLPEQKAIASVLSSLDDKIDLLHRQNKTLESIAETLFRQWFIEEAQDDWEEVSLSQLANIICGKTPSKKKPEYFDGNVPFIKIPDMHGNIYITQTADSLTEEGENSQRNKTIPSFSICVSCIATVGLVSMTIAESQTNQQINTIIPYKEIYRYYLFLYMKNSFDLLQAMGSGGTATLNINTSSFSKMNIDKPDDITLENFSDKVSLIFNKILSNQKQIKTLESLRDTLLPKLISGNIRVKYEAAA